MPGPLSQLSEPASLRAKGRRARTRKGYMDHQPFLMVGYRSKTSVTIGIDRIFTWCFFEIKSYTPFEFFDHFQRFFPSDPKYVEGFFHTFQNQIGVSGRINHFFQAHLVPHRKRLDFFFFKGRPQRFFRAKPEERRQNGHTREVSQRGLAPESHDGTGRFRSFCFLLGQTA